MFETATPHDSTIPQQLLQLFNTWDLQRKCSMMEPSDDPS